MESFKCSRDTQPGRIERLYERLSTLLVHLTPDRQKALDEYIDAEANKTTEDNR